MTLADTYFGKKYIQSHRKCCLSKVFSLFSECLSVKSADVVFFLMVNFEQVYLIGLQFSLIA